MRRHPTVSRVQREAGTTFCEQAGVPLRDQPAALYQLLVLATLLARPISAGLAVAGARELRAAGMRTPRAMRDAPWQQRVDALGRGHYRRFDESAATILGQQAETVLDQYRGDLRRLAAATTDDVSHGRTRPDSHRAERAADLLTELPGLGPAGADIFLREAQRVWPWLVPYVDDRTREGARRLGFAADATSVRRLLARSPDPARLAAAFVRATVDDALVDRLVS